MLLYWDPEKNMVRKPRFDELADAAYTLLQLIPIGYVISYGELAKILGVNPRIVGRLMAINENPIVIPCHRVVYSSGELGGYSRGGADIKKKLLVLEDVLSRDSERVSREKILSAKELYDP